MTSPVVCSPSASTPERDALAIVSRRLAERLGLEARRIDVHESFARHGLDSVGVTALIATLSKDFGRELSPVLAWQCPTPIALARHLSGEDAATGSTRADLDRTAQDEPIAIVGMACRFPNAASPHAFWRLLREGASAIRDVPDGRWTAGALLDAEAAAIGRARVGRGGFLDAIDLFDAAFFRISPREAAAIDPQQRLLMELAWEALEDAGVLPLGLQGTPTGVFVGSMWDEYALLAYRQGADGIHQHTVTGHHRSILANRISYALGLEGPSMAIDSACSASLVAVHLACESLRRGESTLALAGGVNLNILAESALGMKEFGGLSPDGECFTFDARANGYVRGEGGGIVVLKPLSRAVLDGDAIYCVIRGSAVNNDGASNGLTAPNPAAQEEMLRTAYARARVDPRAVQYVELHGTGTPLGDPIEAAALGRVLGAGRPAERPLVVGSAKTNLGHLEGAAGVVGLIKAALCIKHGELVPSLNFETPNPLIPFADARIEVQRARAPWPDASRSRIAGVSSFGMGGTNAHVVLEESPRSPVEAFALAAETPDALRAGVRAWLNELGQDAGEMRLDALCRRAAAAPLEARSRLAVTARSPAELARRLLKLLDDGAGVGVSLGSSPSGASPRIAFVFGGQGGQWSGMGRRLFEREPVFRRVLARCSDQIQRRLGWSLLDALFVRPERSRLDGIAQGFPATVALEIALAAQWRAWGIEPSVVVGHSIGEIAAAHVAGVLDLDDALAIVCAYARALEPLCGQGTMGLVGLGWEDAAAAIGAYDGRLFRAIHQSVTSTVIAGPEDALEALFAELGARGVFCRRVATDAAPHSPLVDEARDALSAALKDLRPRRGRIPLASEVTGNFCAGEELDAAHWMRNLCDPALFSRALDAVIHDGVDLFVELSPHPIASPAIQANLSHRGLRGAVLPSLRRDDDDGAVMRDTAGALYVAGAPISWPAVTTGTSTPREGMALPVAVSARTEASLRAQAVRLREHLDGDPELRLADLAHTLATRTQFERRAVVVARHRAELRDALGALAVGQDAPNVALGVAERPGKLAFLFTGQGAQYAGMGRVLYDTLPSFRAALDAVCDAFDSPLSTTLQSILFAAEGSVEAAELDRTTFTQPALFALEVALYRVVEAWGVRPDALLGHSVGEITAAHVAGVLSLADACALVAARGRLMQELPEGGAMFAIQASEGEVRPFVSARASVLDVAAVNGPAALEV
ncbi:MAG TPA: acyltransferase domain-containing protein, partial [Labilithrix sp.]|nr:acyltransferase domain-containing protein [Labilithrix sp.]